MSAEAAPVNIVVLASGFGSNLQAIIDAIKFDRLSANLSAVISDKADAYALERARREGIPAIAIDAGQFSDRESFDCALQEILNDLQLNLIVLAGFMRILTAEFVNRNHGSIMNIHPSLLPKHKGLNTHRRVLEEGDQFHGATVHFVTPELDAGPIILQEQFQVSAADTVEDLERRVHEIEHEIYPRAIQMFADGLVSITGMEQDAKSSRTP